MSVVLVSSDVFVQQKLASGSVHGCALPDRLFSKANGKWYFRTDRMSEVLISSDVFAAQKPVVRTPKDGRDINQKRVLYKTRLFPTYTEVCREKVYTDVHFRTGYFQKS